ncbi:MAG: hypothetical protein KIT22_17295, partial [Verrucomicrobiae bacterium]|nr:hypothetical protein [Verrucomicrobiae bacterium]
AARTSSKSFFPVVLKAAVATASALVCWAVVRPEKISPLRVAPLRLVLIGTFDQTSTFESEKLYWQDEFTGELVESMNVVWVEFRSALKVVAAETTAAVWSASARANCGMPSKTAKAVAPARRMKQGEVGGIGNEFMAKNE